MVIGEKHAVEFGYDKFIGAEASHTGITKTFNGIEMKEVSVEIRDVPFQVTILIHPEDLTY